MKERIEELIEHYHRKINYLQELIVSRRLINKLPVTDKIRFEVKIESYRQMVNDLNYLLKDDNEEN
jgi:hypothetical protein